MTLTIRASLVFCAILFSGSGPSASWDDPSALCLSAAATASTTHDVPYQVLHAIALVETGRGDRPWPWTVNAAGDGQWFDTREAAEAHAQSVLDEGKTNLDVGCFQLNIRWHSKGFTSLSDMMDPDRNADYAAGFLARHHAETGDWVAAAVAYHSGTPEHAERYRARFEAIYAGLDEEGPEVSVAAAQMNRFPLLVAGAGAGGGSLVPLSGPSAPLIGGN